ncbi:unnamed protein product [Camellia sinensis]
MASLICAVPRTREALLYSILLSSRFIKNPTPKLKSFSIQLSIVPQPHRHCPCSSSSSSNGGVVGVSVGKEEGQLLTSPQLVALEYSDLNLSHNFSQDLGHVRIRQHVNPLCASLSVPAPVPDWSEVYRDSTLPLMVDIGSAVVADFLCGLQKEIWIRRIIWDLKYGRKYGDRFLGYQILLRIPLVKRAEHWVNELALRNIHFMFANATVSFKQLISTYPGPLMLVSILCPDPHFKKKYHKRRVLQKPLVESIVDSLMPQGQVFIQSDVLEVALDMREKFDAVSDELMHIDKIDTSMLCDDEGWLVSNPMGIRTEREIHAEFEGS